MDPELKTASNDNKSAMQSVSIIDLGALLSHDDSKKRRGRRENGHQERSRDHRRNKNNHGKKASSPKNKEEEEADSDRTMCRIFVASLVLFVISGSALLIFGQQPAGLNLLQFLF